VKFQVSTLDDSHHLLEKLSCNSACENLDLLCMPFAANSAVVIVVIAAAIVIAFLYLSASDVHQHTFNRSRVDFALIPEVGLQNLRAYIRRGSYPILERLVDVWS